MVKVSINDDAADLAFFQAFTVNAHSRDHLGTRSVRNVKSMSSSLSGEDAEGVSEAVITCWLEKLLCHFGIHELKTISDQRLIALLASCESSTASDLHSSALYDDAFLLSLKHRIIRLAGAQLDISFMSMAPEVVSLEDTEATMLNVESRLLKGVRYQGEVYRLVETFLPCHRLQAFCLGQTMQERGTAYLITQSSDAFSIWVNVRALSRTSYRHHLPSNASI